MHWPECAPLADCDVELAWLSGPARRVDAPGARGRRGAVLPPITHGEAVTRRKADTPLIELLGGNE